MHYFSKNSIISDESILIIDLLGKNLEELKNKKIGLKSICMLSEQMV